MRDAHSGLAISSYCAWRRHRSSIQLCKSSSFDCRAPSFVFSSGFSSSTCVTDVPSLITVTPPPCSNLSSCTGSSLPHCGLFLFSASSRPYSSLSSCCLCHICYPQSFSVAFIHSHTPFFASSLVRAATSVLSRTPISRCSPTVTDCVFIGIPSSAPNPSLHSSTIFQKSALETCSLANAYRRRSTHTLPHVFSQPSTVCSSSVSCNLSRARSSVVTGTTATVLAAATAVGGISIGTAAVVSAVAATAAIPAATAAGSAVAATAASAAGMFVTGAGILSVVSSIVDSRLLRFLRSSLSLPCSLTSASKRGALISPESPPSHGTSSALDSSSSSAAEQISAFLPASNASSPGSVTGRLHFLAYPLSLQAALSIFRPCPTPAPPSCSPPTEAVSIPLGTDGRFTEPPSACISILRNCPAGASAITGPAGGDVSSVKRGAGERRILTPPEVVYGEANEKKNPSIYQGLRELLEELTVHFWKGNRWKGPQKNKWKWYHRHGYWATRKKLIDFTKYRRYGYHERYGMGRPKKKFWEDPSRYKRLRQAVRFW